MVPAVVDITHNLTFGRIIGLRPETHPKTVPVIFPASATAPPAPPTRKRVAGLFAGRIGAVVFGSVARKEAHPLPIEPTGASEHRRPRDRGEHNRQDRHCRSRHEVRHTLLSSPLSSLKNPTDGLS